MGKAKITHLVRVHYNKMMQLLPDKYENCPCYKKTGSMNVCSSGDDFCQGIFGENKLKQLSNTEFLLECKYSQIGGFDGD